MCARPDVQLARLQQAETHEEERRHTFRSAPPSNFYRRRAIRDNMGNSNADAAQAMEALTSLHFHGPFTFVDHDGSGIAKTEFAHSQGIYLWVQTDGPLDTSTTLAKHQLPRSAQGPSVSHPGFPLWPVPCGCGEPTIPEGSSAACGG